MRLVSTVLAVVAIMSSAALPAEAETARGRVTGGAAYSIPDWFKESFLNVPEDADDARKQGKHVMVFLHLDECPYCAKMLQENFLGGERKSYIQKHFDVIAINIRGDRELVWVDGTPYSEKTLTGHLKVFATPTIVFLDLDGNKILQLNGYRDPRALGHVLEYIQGKRYRSETLHAYIESKAKPSLYTFRDHPQFSGASNFKGYQKPLAILFEDRHCADCARFHDKVLNHPDVLPEMAKYMFARLDSDSSRPLVDPEGNTSTAGQWMATLGMTYRPGVVLYHEGRVIARVDGRLYHYHFKEMLRYVSGEHYKRFGTFSSYSAHRREELLKQGIVIDFSE